ncbi:hypothetical protein M8818_007167 [Zalaria obscura]|uniref:Uncharacterized protein n=1 Tax=Zalaria obscura TaxID=2024903 RepID=A0ACC3S610_9PEZI
MARSAYCRRTVTEDEQNVRPSPPKASTPGAFSRETSPSHGYGTGFSYFKGWMPPQAHIFPQSFPHSSATSVLETGHLQGKAAVGQETSSSDMLGGNPKARRTVQDSPLKVRKTRENLREAVREYNAPNRTPSAQSKSGFFRTSSEEQTPHQPSGRPYHKYSAADMITCPSVAYHRHSLDLDRVRADPTIEEEAHERPSSALEHTPRLSRRKSIHRRVLSKVKEGILTRSRSTAKMIGHKDHDVLDVSIADSMEVQVTLLDARNDLENAPGRLDSNIPGVEIKSHSCGSPSPEKTPRPAYRPRRSPESSPTPLRRASPVLTSPEPLFIKLNVISDVCSLDISKELTTDLFAVTARYRHSAFPDTILSTRETAVAPIGQPRGV